MNGFQNSLSRGCTILVVLPHITKFYGWSYLIWIFKKNKNVFHFEEMWLAKKGYGELAEGIWQANYEVVEEKKVLKKLDTCSSELTHWSKECFGNIKHKLEKRKKQLSQAKRRAARGGGGLECAFAIKEGN